MIQGVPVRQLPVSCLLVLFLGAAPLAAQAAPSAGSLALATNITAVVSGGAWRTGAARGTLRVVELSEGWEAVRHRIVVQWLEEDPARHEVRVRRAVALDSVAPEWFSLASPTLGMRNGRTILSVVAAAAPLERPTVRLSFVVGAPGEIRLLRSR